MALAYEESIPWRVGELERDVVDLKSAVKPVPVLESEMAGAQAAIIDLNESVKSLRAAIVGFALTVAGSSVAVLVGLMVIR